MSQKSVKTAAIAHRCGIISPRATRSVKAFGIDKPAYRQFCPMALGNKGAYWLSDKKPIRNPYFGDAMLTCGETKETL